MVNNNYDYNNALDRDTGFNIENIGVSTNPFIHQTEALKARIFHGANRIEFSFFGSGKSNKEQPSPEAFGKREREDMRALAEFNKVQTSTHAAVGINGLSGLQEGRFNDEKRRDSVDELKRAIDFAAEASTGGAVVFHTGEVPRGMNTAFGGEFKLSPEEEKSETHYLASKRQKALVSAVQEDAVLYLPKARRDKDGNPIRIKDKNGNYMRDEVLNDYVYDYEFDSERGEIKVEKIQFGEWKKDWATKESNQKFDDMSISEKRGWTKKAAVEFNKIQKQSEVLYNLGMSRSYEQSYLDQKERREKILKTLKYYEELKEKVPKDEWWKFNEQARGRDLFVPPENVDPIEYLQKSLTDAESNMERATDLVASGKGRAMEMMHDFKAGDVVAAEDFAVERAADSMADAAVYAIERERQQIKRDKEKYGKDYVSPLEKTPLYLAPESFDPNQYGSHPDELKHLVVEARKNLACKLQNMDYTDKEAKEKAEVTIKATIDIGHLNMWKKHFQRKQGESLDAYDKRFEKWLLDKSEMLAKDGIVKHIHLSDNFGFNDEHLSIGDGNAPIKEFMDRMRKHGVDEFIVEAGGFNPDSAMPDAWEFLGSPVYSVFRPGLTGQTWSDGILQDGFSKSYFGRTEGPRYVVGDYAPSEDFKGAPFYSGVPLE